MPAVICPDLTSWVRVAKDTKKIKVDAYTGPKKSEEKEEDKAGPFYGGIFVADVQCLQTTSCFLSAYHLRQILSQLIS